jgi:hypothetical protein
VSDGEVAMGPAGAAPVADPPPTRRITVLIGIDAGARAAVAFGVGLVLARYLGPASYSPWRSPS